MIVLELSYIPDSSLSKLLRCESERKGAIAPRELARFENNDLSRTAPSLWTQLEGLLSSNFPAADSAAQRERGKADFWRAN